MGSREPYFTGKTRIKSRVSRKRIQYPVTVLFNSCVVIAEHTELPPSALSVPMPNGPFSLPPLTYALRHLREWVSSGY